MLRGYNLTLFLLCLRHYMPNIIFSLDFENLLSLRVTVFRTERLKLSQVT